MNSDIEERSLSVVETGTAAIACEKFASGDSSKKRPLVLLHGYSIQSTGRIYEELCSKLVEDFVVYALDMRGHGGSLNRADSWTFAQVADDIAETVGALELRDPIHAGHSFGGFMGLMTELRYPGTFSALCLLASSAASGGGATPEEVKSTITEQGRNEPVMRELFEQMYLRAVSPDHINHLVEAVAIVDPSVHRAYFYQEYPSIVITDQLDSIQTPVLHLNGAQDSVVDPAEQHRTAQGLPRSKEIIFSDEGHMLPLEAPVRTAREIRNFCQYDI